MSDIVERLGQPCTSNDALRQRKEAAAEIARLRAELDLRTKAFHDHQWRQLKEAHDEIARLRAERDMLLEQIAMRQPSALEKDMQQIMGINNALKAERDALKEQIEQLDRDMCEIAARAIAEKDALRAALRIADDSIRHHLRSDAISAALIQPHAVQAIRAALKTEEGK